MLAAILPTGQRSSRFAFCLDWTPKRKFRAHKGLFMDAFIPVVGHF
jgi:hypothetical protein